MLDTDSKSDRKWVAVNPGNCNKAIAGDTRLQEGLLAQIAGIQIADLLSLSAKLGLFCGEIFIRQMGKARCKVTKALPQHTFGIITETGEEIIILKNLAKEDRVHCLIQRGYAWHV